MIAVPNAIDNRESSKLVVQVRPNKVSEGTSKSFDPRLLIEPASPTVSPLATRRQITDMNAPRFLGICTFANFSYEYELPLVSVRQIDVHGRQLDHRYWLIYTGARGAGSKH